MSVPHKGPIRRCNHLDFADHGSGRLDPVAFADGDAGSPNAHRLHAGPVIAVSERATAVFARVGGEPPPLPGADGAQSRPPPLPPRSRRAPRSAGRRTHAPPAAAAPHRPTRAAPVAGGGRWAIRAAARSEERRGRRFAWCDPSSRPAQVSTIARAGARPSRGVSPRAAARSNWTVYRVRSPGGRRGTGRAVLASGDGPAIDS